MIKLIKLCFVCCLIFRATFVEAVITKEEAYEALKDFDAEFWRDKIVPYYQEQLERWQNTFALLFDPGCPIAQNVASYLDPICKDGLPELFDPDYENSREDFREADRKVNFSSASMLDIISSFYRILQCKVDNRDKEYETNYIGVISNIRTTEHETYIDPYFLEIFVGKNLYHFCLDYNGDERSDQPGNCEIRRVIINKETGKESPFAAEYWSSYAELNKSRMFLFNLLLCSEVSRRKVMDPKRGDFKDRFCDLPILGTIVIGLELMNDQIINKDDFFVTGKKYCCFSNTYRNYMEREEHIKNLLEKFVEYKNFQTVNQFRKEVRRLYQQFIELKITDRVLYLDAEHKSVFQKHTPIQGISSVKNTLNYCSYHIVDINSEEHSLWFAILQNMNPNRYYEGKVGGILSNKDFRWESKKESQVEFLKYLEKIFQQKFIILDATVTDGNCTKWLFNEKGDEDIRGCYYLNGAPYEQAIILLWRGDRWQAVLPD